MHAPLYAAQAAGSFLQHGVEVSFLPAVAREERIARLRGGTADLALLDLASFVDAVAADRIPGARCVFVLTQRLPMAAHFVPDRPTRDGPLRSPGDLLHATYGGTAGSRFVAEHRALLRRIGGDDPNLRVAMPYEQLFDALAAGDIDVAPDFGGLAPRYRRAAGPGQQIATLRYRDCGVRAYGIGLVASAPGLDRRRQAISTFLTVATAAYERMRADPDGVLTAASATLPDLDRAYALQEWREEEAPAIFGYGAADGAVGAWDDDHWASTVAWRAQVGGIRHVEPARLATRLGPA